jgi:CRP-like cAMP-binding protein
VLGKGSNKSPNGSECDQVLLLFLLGAFEEIAMADVARTDVQQWDWHQHVAPLPESLAISLSSNAADIVITDFCWSGEISAFRALSLFHSTTGGRMAKKAEQSQLSDPKMNRILANLETDDYEDVMAHGKVVTLKFHKRLFKEDELIDVVYFPLTAMVSLLVSSEKPKLEMALIGNEGVIGGAETLFRQQAALGLHLVQIEGAAVRIAASTFFTQMRSRSRLELLVQAHMYALTRQILYSASCARLHSMKQRCARWMLMTGDRAGLTTFPLTQEFLSHMLAVRRATVNVAVGMLKKVGYISYKRGQVTILNRPGLEAATCDCYQAINRVYAKALKTLDPA